MANEKISDITAEARGVFDELRKHDYEVVSLNCMESIIDRIEKAAKNLSAGNKREEYKDFLYL